MNYSLYSYKNNFTATKPSVYTYCIYYLGLRPENAIKKYCSYSQYRINFIKKETFSRFKLDNKNNYPKNDSHNRYISNRNNSEKENSCKILELPDLNNTFDKEESIENSVWKTIENESENDFFNIKKVKSIDTYDDFLINNKSTTDNNFNISSYLNIN
tara:strand:- start:106 stop:579 length:474 start_codon:yes stop_codon:yes gene_type:complete